MRDSGDARRVAGVRGRIVQVVNTQDGAVATGTTAMVDDDSIPQNTEGDEYITLAITPKATANRLLIDIVIHLANSTAGANPMMAALFQDSTASALGASIEHFDQNATGVITFRHEMAAGTTSGTTFKVRAGSTAGTTTFNGASGTRTFGGVIASSITITEVAA